jgi:hypothetical protein
VPENLFDNIGGWLIGILIPLIYFGGYIAEAFRKGRDRYRGPQSEEDEEVTILVDQDEIRRERERRASQAQIGRASCRERV